MFSKLLNIGIHPALDFYQKREVKILNLFALITLSGLILGSTNVFFLGEAYPAVAESIVALSTVFVFVFNHKRFYQAAAYGFVITLNGAVFFINEYYDESTATYLFYFPAIFCVALLHNPNGSIVRTGIFFLIVLASFFLSELFPIAFLKTHSFTTEQNSILFYYNLYFTIIITIVLVYMIINLVNKQYSELSELLEKTKSDQVIISGSLKEKEVLLAEIQHRVKNNLAIIIGLFNFQNESTNNEETKSALLEAKNRVLSIAMVHNQLYKKNDLTKINLNTYLSELVQELFRSHPVYSHTEISKNLEDLNLDLTKAVPVGLIVNEVITNSFKHGFKNNTKPAIWLKLASAKNAVNLTITDNGSGFPPLTEITKQSLGLSLIESLTEQIDGSVSFNNNQGAQVILSFPLT